MTGRFAAEDKGTSSLSDQRRLDLASLYADELASTYDDAVQSLESPVLLIVERADSLGARLLDNWLPRPVKWIRRARRLQPGSLHPEFHVLAKELTEVWECFEEAGAVENLEGVTPGTLSVAVVAFEGITITHIDVS